MLNLSGCSQYCTNCYFPFMARAHVLGSTQCLSIELTSVRTESYLLRFFFILIFIECYFSHCHWFTVFCRFSPVKQRDPLSLSHTHRNTHMHTSSHTHTYTYSFSHVNLQYVPLHLIRYSSLC